MYPASRRRDYRGYSPGLRSNPSQLGISNGIDQTMVLRGILHDVCHVKPKKQGRQSEFDVEIKSILPSRTLSPTKALIQWK
ncbi:hypothetical protein A2U01_0054263 [Trifolium medium]|uniref:Uncharacterized protein n=1 Tax=Trifolium medium TaxID=97028 RepID=A0A392RA15_9FABA|nr:hypothetical protein [Trifolium medium]